MNRLYSNTLPVCCRSIIDRHAKWTVAITLIVTLVFAWALPQLRFENAPGKLDLPPDDLVRMERAGFEERFGGGETLLIGLQFDRPIDAEAVRLIRRLTDSIQCVDGVRSVYSITTATEFTWTPSLGVYVLRPRPVVPGDDRLTDTVVDGSVGRLREHSLYRDNLIARDGRSTALILSVDPWATTGGSGLEPLQRLVDSLKHITQAANDQGVAVSYAGTPILNIALQTAMRRDLSVFGPLSAAAFVIVLLVIFRAWRPVLAGLITGLIALVWSVGLLPLTDTPMSIGLSMIIPLVLSFSLMYSVHHLACVYRSPAGTGDRTQVTRCWRSLVIPNFLCGVTTCVGFLSLGISPLPGIREVGVFVGLGVVVSALLANLFLPALLTLWSREAGGHGRGMAGGFVARFIPTLQSAILPRPGLFVIVVAALTLVAGLGIRRLRVETNHLEYLSRDTAVTGSFKFIDANFGGVLPLEILVDVPERLAAEALHCIADIEDSVRALEGVGSVVSAVDFIMEAERSKPQGAALLRPPLHLDKGFVPAQVWDLVTRPTAGGSYVERTDSIVTVRIGCRAHVGGSDRLQLMLDRVRGLLDRHLSDYRTTVTGLAAYFARVEEYVVSTQVNSFAVALGVVVLLLGLLSGSLRAGLAVIAVNVLPVIVVLGTMGWLAIPLDISTVMIAAIALGIVVDDTIHLIYRFRRERQAGSTVEASLHTAFREVGLPVLATTIILAVGFASLLPARFVPTAYFGGLSALTILVAAVADMLLLPALILVLIRRAGKH